MKPGGPDRCDTCNLLLGDLSCWTWITPCTASYEEVMAGKPGFWAEDPEWALCAECHHLMVQYKAGEFTTVEIAARLCDRSAQHQLGGMVVIGFGATKEGEELVQRIADERLQGIMKVVVGFVQNATECVAGPEVAPS